MRSGYEIKLAVNLPFLLCFTLYLKAKNKPPGAYIWRADLTEGFLRYRLGGLIFGILRYFLVYLGSGVKTFYV